MLDGIINSNISRELVTILLAMLPVAELRLALPVAINIFNIPWWEAFGLSVIGNIIPVPFLLLFFEGVSKLVRRNKTGARFIDWLLTRTAKRTDTVEKYKHLGLIVFVALPLPFTGAWTASLISYILGLRVVPSLIDIIVGVLGAGIIVTALSLLGWWGAAIAIAGIIILATLKAFKS